MLIGCIGDIHGRIDRLEQVIAWLVDRHPQYLLVTGDFDTEPAASISEPSVPEAVRRVEEAGIPFLFVPGNHDSRSISHTSNIDGRSTTISELRVFGLGGAPWGWPY